MDLSVQQLRMLREVAEQGTIAAAANQLGYTASAVSQQLAGIEKITGVSVLERAGRNVLLTDAGRELVVYAEVVLSQLEQAKAAVERVSERVAGTLRVGVMESIANTLLPDLLLRLATEYPELVIRTRQVDPDRAMDLVRSGELDLSFTVDYPNSPGRQDDRIDRQLVCRDWFRAIVHIDDPLDDSVLALSALADRPIVASPGDLACGRCILLACREAGFEPDIAHELEDYPTVLRMVAAGAGVGLIPGLGLHDPPPGIRALELKDPVCRTVDLISRVSSRGRPAIEAFLDEVGAVADDFGLDR